MTHLLPQSLIDNPDTNWEALLAWECQRCGEWIREYGPPSGPCRGVRR